MVDESRQVTLVCWIYHLLVVDLHQVCAHGFLLKYHTSTYYRVVLNSPPPQRRVYVEDLTNVLHDELPFQDPLSGT